MTRLQQITMLSFLLSSSAPTTQTTQLNHGVHKSLKNPSVARGIALGLMSLDPPEPPDPPYLGSVMVESNLVTVSFEAPRWASVNLGIFISMQCSGIHRSLGVHISQVSFMQSTGNAKAKHYWESELPPHFERSSCDAFIRAKYVEKKWVSPGGIQPVL